MRLIVPKYWMKHTLLLAGIFNLLWACWLIITPYSFFDFYGLPHPNYPIIWQGIGMVIGVYGLGFIFAASKPYVHWPIVAVGFLGKLLGTFGFLYFYFHALCPYQFGYLIFLNDLLWLIPFGMILFGAFEYHQAGRELDGYDLHGKRLRSLSGIRTERGENLEDISKQQPTLLVFLRHFGCTFCREALTELQRRRPEIEEKGTRIVLVHMVEQEVAEQHLRKYDLDQLSHISDPEKGLYRAFGLCKGSFSQLLGFNVVLRWFDAGLVKGHFSAAVIGDALQMPGVFLIHRGMIVQSFTHTSAADRPDYVEMADGKCRL